MNKDRFVMSISLAIAVLALVCGFGQGSALAQVVNTCNSFDPSGVPIYSAANPPNTTGTPVCTDFFGVGNWANSPVPAGTITGFTIITGGSGYANPVVVITDPTGTGATATATQTAGVITGITGSGSNYSMPLVTIVDAGPCGGVGQPVCGTGAMASAVIGPPFTAGTGILKFQDPLIDLKTVIATPDTTKFPGSDYYEIAAVEYKQKMHSSLPATTLRGYVQLPSGSSGCPAAPVANYLGPVILAQKDKAVRVKFTNCLPTGTFGDLFIPVDTTYMGAGMGPNGATYTQNRATLHLHGGATPWISDGTPHQWTVPQGEATSLATGDSVVDVPDMFFFNGVVVPQCSATVTTNCSGGTAAQLPVGATNNPGAGSLTFYWTNQQGGRLMFYHDHAYGLTRLNVYAGEAAGYLLYDAAEEAALATATAPGSITAGDLTHLIPLVIQDKSFVPSSGQLAAQDPTWAGNFGATPLLATSMGNGDLWFPHIYIPNQNPNDPTGANGVGRWDYGPWFFPPQNTLTAGPVTIPCTSAAFPGQLLQPTSACPTCGCPITPNPSGTPEAFMDTPVVNGVAYPVLHVAPAAYRFKILSAGNDRSWNLSWFVADATQGNTEVKMLPAVPATTGAALPLCTAANPIAVPPLNLGLVTALFDAAGNPLNGTGLPANCWPNYGPQPGIPKPQTMWAADGRNGGAPDPTKAGPPWIQIGTEGGLLPAPVVIPATPINYEQNVRSITVGSVAVHGLWLGPAERADVIVDFSQFANQTLILYNDAPAAVPAFDSRLDYFTGNGDQVAVGGAPSTQPGYGPNTRTIMQVVVDQAAPNVPAFNLTTLKNAFASTTTLPTAPNGLFATTQPTTIVPEAGYNSAYNQTFPNTYASIQANTLTFTPIATTTPATPLTFNQSCTATAPAQCAVLGQKTIQELFTPDYGRMNATLGVELPLTNFLTQTTIPYGYIDPPTEIIKQGDTQLWKITHNGVDTHFIHFHLFNVQVVNRVGWDGSIRQPDANELGWKDTVRMNPLEDILVALQPITPTMPFPIPDSIRQMDVTTGPNTTAQFTGVDPNNLPITVTNTPINFGWEYVWHCHILGHEENDMMRPIIFQVAPPAPANLAANAPTPPNVVLTWIDKSASETTFTLQRDLSANNFSSPVSFTVTSGTPGFSTPGYGQTVTFTDTSATPGVSYSYRVRADDNFQPLVASNPAFPAAFEPVPLSSGWSNVATVTSALITPTVTFTGAPVSAAFNSTFTVTATTNAAIAPTIAGTAGVCSVGAVTGTSPATALVTMTSGTGTCGLTASWAANATYAAATATQSTTAILATPTVAFTGAPATAINGATFTVTATTNAAIAPTIAGTAGVCSVGAVTGTSPATALVTMTSGTGTCGLTASWAANATYAAATATQSTTAILATPTTTFTGALASAAFNSTFTVTATTNAAIAPTIAGTAGVCSVGAVTGTSPATALVTMTSGTGTCGLTASWAANATYAAATNTQSTAATKLGSTTTITSHTPNPSVVGQPVAVNVSVTGAGPIGPTGSVTVTGNGSSCVATITGGTGSCSLTLTTSGAKTLTASYGGDTNYNISTSAGVAHTVRDFSVTLTPASRTINGNQSTTYTMTLRSVGGFTGSVALSCGGNFPGTYSCSVSRASATLTAGGTATATVTVNTRRGNPGTYNVTATGRSGTGVPATGGLTHAATSTVTTRN